jgi:hypothetical protein
MGSRKPGSLKMGDSYAYQGPLGEVIHNGRFFFASKDEFLIGRTYNTFEEAMESLALKEILNTR